MPQESSNLETLALQALVRRLRAKIGELERDLQYSAPEHMAMRNEGYAALLSDALPLLAEAARQHPEEKWAVRADQLIPELDQYRTCSGKFSGRPWCDEFHQHTLVCGDPLSVCELCGKTNAEHRTSE